MNRLACGSIGAVGGAVLGALIFGVGIVLGGGLTGVFMGIIGALSPEEDMSLTPGTLGKLAVFIAFLFGVAFGPSSILLGSIIGAVVGFVWGFRWRVPTATLTGKTESLIR